MHPDIEALRAHVQHQCYRPRALVTFLVASVAVARRTATRHPDLVRSWRRRALCRALTLPLVAQGLGCPPWSRALWLTYLWQQGDLYLHLGLNRRPDARTVRTAFPLPTECTLLRAYAAAALMSGCERPRRTLVIGVVTDVLDGFLARHLRQQTVLGALLDSEYDVYLALTALWAIRRRGRRERVLEQAIALRFGGQFLMGFIVFFTHPHPVAIGSTRAGKLSGAVQALALYRALGESGVAYQAGQLMRVALRATAVGAVVAQGLRYVRPHHAPLDRRSRRHGHRRRRRRR